MAGPRYFFALFGNPTPPDKDTVASGVYHPDKSLAPYPVRPGDVLLLYCTENYVDYPVTIPGIGVVTRTGDITIEYRYLPFGKPVAKEMLEQSFVEVDRQQFDKRRFPAFWLFEMSRESFTPTVGRSVIEWP